MSLLNEPGRMNFTNGNHLKKKKSSCWEPGRLQLQQHEISIKGTLINEYNMFGKGPRGSTNDLSSLFFYLFAAIKRGASSASGPCHPLIGSWPPCGGRFKSCGVQDLSPRGLFLVKLAGSKQQEQQEAKPNWHKVWLYLNQSS